MEAAIIVGTDAGVFIVRSELQPIDAKPFISPSSSIVDMAFNGNAIAIATGDRSVKFYTVQVN